MRKMKYLKPQEPTFIRCSAAKSNGQRCKTHAVLPKTLCHVHDPEGKFQQQQKNKGHNVRPVKIAECQHKYYMRDAGIQCAKCGDVWQSQNTNT